ncbi:hypothetical protein OPU71_18455 [Niveibacterium sp. 24ML]|uniref:hypothetical protein n=1 Tax=Niveibacterium sp. 24ML TaxID=2985512 RepID=UPI0022717C6D|nr:hypothetical protein [Niveibacterium sp. 24ML]MCX9158108.1 hypothetical protein [Niveibacterium sp. 24ML]
MFDSKTELHTKEAAAVLATGKCLLEGRGRLIHLPAAEPKHPGYAVWSGLVLSLSGNVDYQGKEHTYVTMLDGRQFNTSLSLQAAMALVASGATERT